MLKNKKGRESHPEIKTTKVTEEIKIKIFILFKSWKLINLIISFKTEFKSKREKETESKTVITKKKISPLEITCFSIKRIAIYPSLGL